MQNRECIVLERTHDTKQRTASCVRVCESRVHPVFNQSSGGFIYIICIIRVYLSHLPAEIFFCLPLRKIILNAAKFIVFEANNSESLIGAP